MSRKISFEQNEYYHVYNRGAHKEAIFLDEKDYWRFTFLLYAANSTRRINFWRKDNIYDRESVFKEERKGLFTGVIAYCLMPNHFHILLQEKTESGASKFLHKLCTSYSMYYNKKYAHPGTLFQGPYQAKYVSNDSYLNYLQEYIHLNPYDLKHPGWKDNRTDADVEKAFAYCEKYVFSSLRDYRGEKRPQGAILGEVFTKTA